MNLYAAEHIERNFCHEIIISEYSGEPGFWNVQDYLILAKGTQNAPKFVTDCVFCYLLSSCSTSRWARFFITRDSIYAIARICHANSQLLAGFWRNGQLAIVSVWLAYVCPPDSQPLAAVWYQNKES